MFVRLKKLKGNNYAYLVVNTWTKKGPRQKTKKYLGRCYNLNKKKELDFKEHYKVNDIEAYVHSNSAKKVISRIMEFELLKHGFEYDKRRKGSMIFGELEAKPKTMKIYHGENKNDVVLKINEGHLCEYLIKKILKFNFKGVEEDTYKFADSFIMSGLEINKEVFVELFQKTSHQ